jgi:hypothetical protein
MSNSLRSVDGVAREQRACLRASVGPRSTTR